MVVDNFLELWIIIKNLVENYPFMTKILQKNLKFLFFIQHFFQKSIQKLKNKKFVKTIDKRGNYGV